MSKGARIKYSEEELSFIQKNCKMARKELCDIFCKKFNRDDVSFENIKRLCLRRGWITGRNGCFPKGHVSFNKGMKQSEYMSKEGMANSSKSEFKKGRTPHNTKYEGHESITRDGYVLISVKQKNKHTGFERSYVLKHRYLWEKKNGELPKDMILKCLDGNKLNTDPNNWEAISRSVLPFLNGGNAGGQNYDLMPDELKPVVLSLAKLRGKESQKSKKNNERI